MAVMKRGWFRLTVELLVVVLLALFLAALGDAMAKAAPAGVRWTGDKTCVPGSIQYDGAYRIYDNGFLEEKQCATAHVLHHGAAITITSNAVPNGGTVVADPEIRFGEFFTDRDQQSGLPLPVTQLGHLTLHVASTGRAKGAWQSDADIYLAPDAAAIPHHHATFELVISNRYAWKVAGRGDPVQRIAGVEYRWASWMTCQRLMSGGCDPKVPDWRIAVFWRTRAKAKARIYVPAFTGFLIRQHLLPRRDVLASVAFCSELWSGGKGLTDSLFVTGLGIPHLGPGQ